MYIPPLFREERSERLEALMRENPLATLVTVGEQGLIASHIPLVYEANPGSPGILHGHVARANPQWQEVRPDAEALAIFHGPQAYVSPNWYPSRQETGRVVPTWNYAVVHAYGRLETYSDAARLWRHLETLTRFKEAGFISPWKMDEAPREFLAGLMQGIVGINIHITRIEGKFKVSQNRSAEDRAGAVQGLLNLGDAESAAIAHLANEYAPKKCP